MESSDMSLSSFMKMQKEHFVETRIKPFETADALASALIRELEANVPGVGAHPNATGNMLRALTTRSEVRQYGPLYWVGVGSKELLGDPSEKAYKPKPIERFLKWYRQQQSAERATRQEQRAITARRRELQRAYRERAIAYAKREYNLRLWYNRYTRESNRSLRKMYNRIEELQRRIDYWRSNQTDLSARAEATGHRVWQERSDILNAKIYRMQREKRDLEDSFKKRSEALIEWQNYMKKRFKRWSSGWQVSTWELPKDYD